LSFRRKRELVSLLALVGALSFERHANAFTIESQLSPGCHEGMTTDALRAVRKDLATARPLARSGDDGPLIDDLPFSVDDDMADIGGATLLIGIRDNDLKGRGAESLDQLIEIHGDPAHQREHCLRTPDEDEPGGSAVSVADCRAFIRERAVAAIDNGLDATGTPDAARRTVVKVSLSLAGVAEAGLPTFYLEIGRAMHALQDSFAHDFRSADGLQITVALNWVDFAESGLVESRDGPPHMTPLDKCDDADALRTLRHRLAVQASTELLRATLDPSLDRAGKLAAVDATLDKYLTYQPGCTFDNGWCDAPERSYQSTGGCGCNLVQPGPVTAGAALVLVALASMLRRRTKTHAS
jgi:hypothetical protein